MSLSLRPDGTNENEMEFYLLNQEDLIVFNRVTKNLTNKMYEVIKSFNNSSFFDYEKNSVNNCRPEQISIYEINN